MSRSNTVNSAASDPQHHQQFQQIIQKWEKVKADPAHIDPTEVLCEMADILEKVRYIFFDRISDLIWLLYNFLILLLIYLKNFIQGSRSISYERP